MEYVGAEVQSPMMTITSASFALTTYNTFGTGANGTKPFVVEVESFVEREGGVGTNVVTRDEGKSYFHGGLQGVVR